MAGVESDAREVVGKVIDRARAAQAHADRWTQSQAHCFATGGSFDNALPFSLSMGCGSWGGNSFSDNLNWRHFINVTRVVHPIAPHLVNETTEADVFDDYLRRHGA